MVWYSPSPLKGYPVWLAHRSPMTEAGVEVRMNTGTAGAPTGEGGGSLSGYPWGALPGSWGHGVPPNMPLAGEEQQP